MVRKNCEGDQNKQLSLLDMQSGHSEKEKSNPFSVVSSKIRNLTNKFYNLSYMLGLNTLKAGYSVSHSINKNVICNVNRCCRVFKVKIRYGFKAIKSSSVTVTNTVKKHCIKVYNQYGNIKAEYKKRKANSFLSGLSFLRDTLVGGVKNNKNTIVNFMNYVYPIGGLAIFIATINIICGFKYGLSIDCLGKHIGCVENEYVFLDASKEMNSRINYDQNQEPINCLPKYTLVRLNKNANYNNKDEIANRLLKASDKMVCFATGLYVNDNFIGAVKNGKEMQNLLDSFLQPYKKDYPNDEVSFVDDVVIEKGYYLTASVCNLAKINKAITKNVEDKVVYTVRKGDVPIEIAKKNSVPYEQIKNLNPDIEQSLKPGEEILVKNSKPFLSVQVNKVSVEDDTIPFEVEKVEDPNISRTFNKVIRQGRNGVVKKEYKTTIIDGVIASSELVNEQILVMPENQKILIGTKSTGLAPYEKEVVVSNLNMISPVYGGRVSCAFHGYRGHTGVDIVSTTNNSSIVASAAGRVVFAGWRGAYGYCAVVSHGNGIATLYAHNTKLLVSTGDKVSQGAKIAVMGQTGNAYGVHCHFEVRKNGKPVNPESCVKLR